MALPTSRNRTYTTDTPVDPNDLNDIQDAMIGGWHGEKTIHLAPATGMINNSVAEGSLWKFITNGGGYYGSGGGGTDEGICFPLPLSEGDRLKSVKVFLRDTTAGHEVDSNIYIGGITSPYAATQIGTIKTSAGDGTVQTLTHLPADGGATPLPHEVGADQFISLQLTVNDATMGTTAIYGVEIVVDRGVV